MVKHNTWHQDQLRTNKRLFKPKWNKETILSVQRKIDANFKDIDIEYGLVKKYDVCLATAQLWLKMVKRIIENISNGDDIDQAIIKDRKFRNRLRRKK